MRMKGMETPFTGIRIIIVFFSLLALCSLARAQGQGEDDPIVFKETYLLELTGTVHRETFSGAQAILTLMTGREAPIEPFLILVNPYPKLNSRNAFVWNSENMPMEVVFNQYTSRVNRFSPSVPVFFYLSPVLLVVLETHRYDDDLKAAKKRALPTPIDAMAGKLKVRIYEDTVTGTVWLNGYDKVQRSYVFYSAQINGRKVHGVRPSVEKKKSWYDRAGQSP